MNSRSFIHFLLIAVLGFNPVAANMHIVDHFDNCESDAAAASTDCQTQDHHAHHAEHGAHLSGHDLHTSHVHSENQSKFSVEDCGIYHVYASQSGCVSTAQSMLGLPVHSVVNSVAKFGDIPTGATDKLRIRGPPAIS